MFFTWVLLKTNSSGMKERYLGQKLKRWRIVWHVNVEKLGLQNTFNWVI